MPGLHAKGPRVLRARIVLAAADGLPNRVIAGQLGCSRTTVGHWRAAFATQGLAGLENRVATGPATAGCGAGTGMCAFTPGTNLATGAATWWIQTWSASLGYGPWSAPLCFTIP